MDNAKSLLTVNYKLDSAHNFVSSLEDNNYYLFVGNHINANNDTRPFDNEQDTTVSAYYGMIFGKKINSNDVKLAARRVDWESGVVFDVYDHRDETLYSKEFYVVVHEGTQWDVFKCLENGNGNPSTVAPSRTNVSSGGEDFYYPVDGYRWKYMYSITDADFDKFATTTHMPVINNANTTYQAVDGEIAVVSVETPGSGYGNYLNGSFGVGDIRLNGDPKKYAISVSGAKTTNGYYDACWLYVASGDGAGQYRMIETYSANATHNYVILQEQFDPSDQPQNGSVFEITPSVKITGDGRQTLPANARAIINPTGNTVSRVEMIDRGAGYKHATAQVMAAASVGVTSECGVVPIMSPKGGHGYNSELELAGKFVCVSAKLEGDENGTVITGNDYSQIGIVKNPQFRSVEITLTNQNRDFFTNEHVYKFTTSQLSGTVQTVMNANNELTTSLSVATVNANSIVKSGQTIVISDEINYQMANVVSVSNTEIIIDQAALWDTGSNTANIHLAWTSSHGLVDGYSTGAVILTDACGSFQSGDRLIGAETGVYAEIDEVKIGGVAKNFETFMQAYAYVGSMTQGSFTADELLYQVDNDVSIARFHSIAPDANTGTYIIYTTNQSGTFNTLVDDGNLTDEIKGATSGSIASLTNKYLPDLVYGSGEVVYVEYGEPITRAAEKSETFKLVFAF